MLSGQTGVRGAGVAVPGAGQVGVAAAMPPTIVMAPTHAVAAQVANGSPDLAPHAAPLPAIARPDLAAPVTASWGDVGAIGALVMLSAVTPAQAWEGMPSPSPDWSWSTALYVILAVGGVVGMAVLLGAFDIAFSDAPRASGPKAHVPQPRPDPRPSTFSSATAEPRAPQPAAPRAKPVRSQGGSRRRKDNHRPIVFASAPGEGKKRGKGSAVKTPARNAWFQEQLRTPRQQESRPAPLRPTPAASITPIGDSKAPIPQISVRGVSMHRAVGRPEAAPAAVTIDDQLRAQLGDHPFRRVDDAATFAPLLEKDGMLQFVVVSRPPQPGLRDRWYELRVLPYGSVRTSRAVLLHEGERYVGCGNLQINAAAKTIAFSGEGTMEDIFTTDRGLQGVQAKALVDDKAGLPAVKALLEDCAPGWNVAHRRVIAPKRPAPTIAKAAPRVAPPSRDSVPIRVPTAGPVDPWNGHGPRSVHTAVAEVRDHHVIDDTPPGLRRLPRFEFGPPVYAILDRDGLRALRSSFVSFVLVAPRRGGIELRVSELENQGWRTMADIDDQCVVWGRLLIVSRVDGGTKLFLHPDSEYMNDDLLTDRSPVNALIAHLEGLSRADLLELDLMADRGRTTLRTWTFTPGQRAEIKIAAPIVPDTLPGIHRESTLENGDMIGTIEHRDGLHSLVDLGRMAFVIADDGAKRRLRVGPETRAPRSMLLPEWEEREAGSGTLKVLFPASEVSPMIQVMLREPAGSDVLADLTATYLKELIHQLIGNRRFELVITLPNNGGIQRSTILARALVRSSYP